MALSQISVTLAKDSHSTVLSKAKRLQVVRSIESVLMPWPVPADGPHLDDVSAHRLLASQLQAIGDTMDKKTFNEVKETETSSFSVQTVIEFVLGLRDIFWSL